MKESPSRKIFYRTWRILRGGLIAAGAVAVIAIILAFTTAPFWTWYGIGSKKAGINRQPDYIVLLGGGGMPSESGLMRSWYTARVASYFSHSTIIIALPGIEKDTSSSVNLVKKELILRGISPGRIVLESAGTNTRAQALNIIERISNIECRMSNIDRKKKSSFVIRHSSLLLVTSPEHLLRAVLTFHKAGFLMVDGLPTFEQDIESDMTFTASRLGGRRFIPDVGNSITLRYQFWTQMNYELLIVREWMALGYYWIMGWI